MQVALGKLITFHNNNQVLIKKCCYGNSRFTPSWPPSWNFQKIILCKTAANFTEISRKHVFAASNRNIIKNTCLEEEIIANLPQNLQFSISNFHLHN